MKKERNRRLVFFIGFLVCAALLGYAYYAQYVQGLMPCPLCILQRVAFFIMGLCFLIAALHNPGTTGYRLYTVPILLAGVGGIIVAGRHLWLQSLPPDQVPACGPGLNYILDSFPPAQAIELIFRGSGSCAEVDWQFLGLAMPAWTLIWFVVLMLAAIYFAARRGAAS